MKCYHCNVEISEGSISCPHCGKRIEVNESLKCPQCNLDVPEGIEYCPNCGSHIGTQKLAICKKCGTEQKEGQKFCPKCGTPYMNVEQSGVKSSNEESIEVVAVQQKGLDNNSEKEQSQEGSIEDNNVYPPLNPNEEKKFLRIAKAGMWIISIAIVLTFLRSGFGFSFWWYIYLIIMAFIAFLFLITSNSKVRESRRLDSSDSFMIKTISWIGAIMLAILYLWGPLNSNYEVSRDKSESYSHGQSSSSDSYEQTSSFVSFSTEQDVRTFLCTNKFSSSDGFIISFSNNANELSMNGKLLTSYVEVRLQGPSNAILRTHGPYGITTFLLSISGSEGFLVDKNDGTIYSN